MANAMQCNAMQCNEINAINAMHTPFDQMIIFKMVNVNVTLKLLEMLLIFNINIKPMN